MKNLKILILLLFVAQSAIAKTNFPQDTVFENVIIIKDERTRTIRNLILEENKEVVLTLIERNKRIKGEITKIESDKITVNEQSYKISEIKYIKVKNTAKARKSLILSGVFLGAGMLMDIITGVVVIYGDKNEFEDFFLLVLGVLGLLSFLILSLIFFVIGMSLRNEIFPVHNDMVKYRTERRVKQINDSKSN